MVSGPWCVGMIPRNPVAKCMLENCRFGKSWGGVFRSMVSVVELTWDWVGLWLGLGAWGFDLGGDWYGAVLVRIGALKRFARRTLE